MPVIIGTELAKTSQRIKFEAWVLGQNICKKYGAKLTMNADGSYRDYRINDRWNAPNIDTPLPKGRGFLFHRVEPKPH